VSLAAGSKLGPYEILGQIGAGGMGEVYRARDPRLSREVAIKVLPASFSADADRLRRFEQEAKAAGVLNHPNITAVYDIGSASDGAPYVVQELLEGETLRSELAGGRLTARKVVDHALQIAHGLAAAHEKGIVHRDLKPENVFVTNDGRVKILDFGLAKLTQAEGSVSSATNLPTETKGTEPGVVLGTLGYMSPEQVRGKAADARSDIFSFGAILYEMLSGKRAFHGDSAADTMSAILREDPPDLSVTNQAISPGLDRIVRHCLEKNPEQRFHSAHDLAFDIEALSSASGQAAAAPARARDRRLPPIALLAAGLLAGAALTYLGLRGAPRRSAAGGGAQPTFRRLTNLSGAEEFPSLSPDGQMLAFLHRSGGKNDVWVQRTDSRKPTDLTADCDRTSFSPAFSPDGSLIAYASRCGDGGLFVMGTTGENVRRLASFGNDPAWSPDGREIVFSTEGVARPYGRSGTSEIWAVEVGTGKTRRVLEQDGIQPSVSPHGLRIAYWALPTGGSQRDIWTIPHKGLAAGEKPVPVTQDPAVDWYPVWAPDGLSLYFLSNRDGAMNLWRIPIDEATGRTLGPAEREGLPAREVGGIALARDGRHLAFVDQQTTYGIVRLSFDTEGRLLGKPEEVYESSQEMADFDVSPDGKQIAFDSRGGAQDDLYLLSTDGSGLRQLLDDAPKDRHPTFTPDGKHLVFISDRSGRYQVWAIATDGSGLTQVTKSDKNTLIEPSMSPDGRRIAFHTERNAFVIRLDEKGIPGPMEEIPQKPETILSPTAWSGDGRLVFGTVVGSKERSSIGLFAYDVTAKKMLDAFPGIKTLGRATRASVLGSRLVYRDVDGIHVADPASGADRLVLPHPAAASYPNVACRASTCYAIRVTDNADIWMRTTPETAAK
jgi:Tol biopolymer transport system component/predicted Ser/Thr protein kinase